MKRFVTLFFLATLIFAVMMTCSCSGEADLSLKSVSVRGAPINGFSGDVLEYELEYRKADGMPTAEEISYVKANPDTTVTLSTVEDTVRIKVSSKDGEKHKEYIIKMKEKPVNITSVTAEIVNKNGAKGVLTLVSDDGDQRTSDFFYTEIAPNYDAFKITIALPTKKVASLSKTKDGKAWLIDDDGNYVLTVLPNTYSSVISGSPFKGNTYATMVDFWNEITKNGQIELASHSHTHGPWPATDDIVYSGNTIEYPAGSAIKELHASAQILRDLLGQDSDFILRPGGAFMTTEVKNYFKSLFETDTTFLGMRGSNGAPPLPGATSANGAKLNTVDKFKKVDGRLSIATLLVRGYEAAFNESGDAFATTSASTREEILAAGISAWEQYVDYAMQYGSWASIGFHSVVSDSSTASGYQVYDSQVKALMDYVQPLVDSGDLWLASFSDAAKYYFEWSSATLVATSYDDEYITVRLNDAETDERFDEALTVKVTVPDSWDSARLESYGETTDLDIHVAEDGTHFVYANILPGSEESTIRPH